MGRFGTVLNPFACIECLIFWARESQSKNPNMAILSIQECRYLQSSGGWIDDPGATQGMRGVVFLLIDDIFKCI